MDKIKIQKYLIPYSGREGFRIITQCHSLKMYTKNNNLYSKALFIYLFSKIWINAKLDIVFK